MKKPDLSENELDEYPPAREAKHVYMLNDKQHTIVETDKNEQEVLVTYSRILMKSDLKITKLR